MHTVCAVAGKQLPKKTTGLAGFGGRRCHWSAMLCAAAVDPDSPQADAHALGQVWALYEHSVQTQLVCP